MGSRIQARLNELGITLPRPGAVIANYAPFVTSGSLVFVSGQLPMEEGTLAVAGHVGAGITADDGYRAARLCALNLLAQVRSACGGDLERLRRVVRLSGFVAAAPSFTDIPKVINGASDLMIEVLGDAGRHARVAVGVASLPMGAAVEVDGIFEIAC